MDDLELQRKSLPHEPGVYFFTNKENKIIYVGKALNLKKRVSQYFLKSTYSDPFYEEKIKELVKNITSIQYIVTENEKEAYILENIQIKKNLPRYNVFMRDSKTYPWVAIFYSEKFPRIRIIRGPEKYSKKNTFIGPYTDKKEITRILRDLRKIFPYCSCKKERKKSKRPCLYYQLKLCPGPCIDALSQKEYRENIKKIGLFLRGETHELKRQIKKKMDDAAENQDFENAAYWRDKLQAIDNSTTQQNVLLDNGENKDIIGYFSDVNQKFFSMVIIHIREGKIANKSPIIYNFKDKVIRSDRVFPSILEQYYQNIKSNLPDLLVIPQIYENIDVFTDILKDHNPNIHIRTPFKNEFGLVRIANKNARVIVEQEIEMEEIKKREHNQIEKALEGAKDILHMEKKPRIIEGFDISNIEGTDATGSMVFFLEGKPYNRNYRYYKIKSKKTPDDVAMMKEVIYRRYSMLLERNWELPDLILVDGGKGQLNAGVAVLRNLGLDGIPIVGLAKRFEEIYLPDEKEPLILPKNSPLLKLFQRVRDEAHRFAVKLHKKQREKRITGSILDEIKGVGPVTRNKLLTYFGSIDNIKKASIEEISQIVGEKLAKSILEKLKD